jgi:hypothetical protein
LVKPVFSPWSLVFGFFWSSKKLALLKTKDQQLKTDLLKSLVFGPYAVVRVSTNHLAQAFFLFLD